MGLQVEAGADRDRADDRDEAARDRLQPAIADDQDDEHADRDRDRRE